MIGELCAKPSVDRGDQVRILGGIGDLCPIREGYVLNSNPGGASGQIPHPRHFYAVGSGRSVTDAR